jgi:hypothetical protein
MERLGLIGRMDNVMAALCAEIEAGGMAAPPWPPFRAPTLGLSNVTVARLLDVIGELASPRKEPTDLPLQHLKQLWHVLVHHGASAE